MQPVAEFYLTFQYIFVPEQRFHQRTFAGAVLADYAKVVTFIQLKVKLGDNGLALVAESQIRAFYKRHQLSASFSLVRLSVIAPR